MTNRIYKIKVVKVRGGVEVQGLSRSRRGTGFVLDSVVILDSQESLATKKANLATAAESLLQKHNVTREFPRS